jgi:HSP20 family molecular chaperone IbpA
VPYERFARSSEVCRCPRNTERLQDLDAINISGFGNTLTVSGDLREEWQVQDDGGRWVLRAQNFGAFERVLTLTTAIVPDAAATNVANGVLTIALPKFAGRLP